MATIRNVEVNRDRGLAEKIEEKEIKDPTSASEEVRTQINQVAAKTSQTRIKDIYRHLNYAHERMDRHEELLKGVYNKIDRLLDEVKDVKLRTEGKDIEFERALRAAKETIPELTKSQAEIFGTIAPQALRDIVEQVLGTDFGAYTRSERALPTTFFTLLVPKRLSGMEMDFRSQSISNASPEADVKKWCEKVKSNIFRQFTLQNTGTPRFLINE